ncbi:hypothetical protein Chor_013184 [Crotalus horridus]
MSGRPKRWPPRAGASSPPPPGKTAKKRVKRQICVDFSAALREPALKEKVAAAWARQEPLEHDFIPSRDFLEELRRELLTLDFHEKCNDLYKFKQSDDLKRRGWPHIAALRKVLFEEFRSWLSDVIQVELEPTIDLSCAKYEYTEARQSQKVVKCKTVGEFQIVMLTGMCLVSEVISKEKCRLSVSGWFHGPSLPRPPRPVEPQIPRSPHIPRDHEILYDWINPVYLDMDSQAQIQEEFEDRSEILLKDFLKRDKYQRVCKALKTEGLGWSTRGPPNHSHDADATPEEEEEGGGGESSESSQRPSSQEEAGNTDCTEASGSVSENEDNQENDWNVESGGFTSYIAKGEDEELLMVNPEANCLALVYRDRETQKFVKYINHRSLEQTPDEKEFWDFSFVYYE